MKPTLSAASVLLVALALPPAAAASDFQLWGELNLQYIKSHQITMGVDIEPKVLVIKDAGDPEWATLDITPSFEYSRGNWFDAIGELLIAKTKQTDDISSAEITPRAGFRFHFLSNLRNDVEKEKRSKQRLIIRDLVRLEWRNLYYSENSGKPDSSSFRLRNRIEVEYPLNRARVADNGAAYAMSDFEWFWTEDDVDERFVSKERLRAGIGFRQSYAWRYEVLYVWDRSRKALTDNFTTADSAIDIRVKKVW